MPLASAGWKAEAMQPNAVSPNLLPEDRKVPKSNIGQAILLINTKFIIGYLS